MPADTQAEQKPGRPESSAPAKPAHGGGTLALALDFGPLLVFFLAFKFLGVLTGTLAFMVAIVVAVAVSLIMLKRVSPMLWLSAAMVLFFGGLTLYLEDERFIQMKPTVIYCFFSALLFGGLMFGKPLLKYLLQAAYDGLSDAGWRKLSLNWAVFFAFLALFNEAARAWLSFDTWLTVKVWGVTALSFLFAAANLPMLMKHGLAIGAEGGAEDIGETKPPEG